MSKALNSPTSRLLQNSRLFSLPRPLPQPQLETVTSTGLYRASDTSTLPYPTHQAIATPASSHFRGDWGLKRPLPAKATRGTTNPHLRIRAHDNAAHITDFESALDHTQTEAKWREMGVPIVVKRDRYSTQAVQSIYDEDLDNTDPDAVTSSSRSAKQRWKHRGPWVSGMSEGEFEIYLTSRVAERKGEFREFMIERIVKRRLEDEKRVLRERGEGGSVPSSRAKIRQDVESNYEAEEKRLRDNHARDMLNSDLTAALCDFLDLPLARSQKDHHPYTATREMGAAVAGSLTKEEAPPSTHPAAGLSYIRSNSYMENHPLYGPQASRSPVLARVLRPRNAASGHDSVAKLGVGGVVAADRHESYQPDRRRAPQEGVAKEELYKNAELMTHELDETLEGGNKIWVQPQSAHIDDAGHIKLNVTRSDKETIAVKTDDVEALEEARGTLSPSRPAGPASRTARGVEGFDEQVNELRRNGTTDQAQMIRDILKSGHAASNRR